MLANATRPIGAFDQQAVLLLPDKSFDEAGQEHITWTPLATVWVREMPQRGLEQFLSQQRMGTALLRLELREYRGDVTVLNRITFRGKDWDIQDVRPIGRHEGLALECYVRAE